MRPDRPDRIQLFQFTVPGLSQTPLAVLLSQVLEVTESLSIVPIPFAPESVLGIAEWRNDMITVFDLADRMCTAVDRPITHDTGGRYMVAQVVVGAKPNLVAWPILSGASVVAVPPKVPQVKVSGLSVAMVYAALSVSDSSVALLNLEEIVSLGF